MGAITSQCIALTSAALMMIQLAEFPAAEAICHEVRYLQRGLPAPDVATLLVQVLELLIVRYRAGAAAAVDGLRAILAPAAAKGDRQLISILSVPLGEALLDLQDWAGAESVLLPACEIARHGIGDLVRFPCLLSRAYTGQGRLAEARALLAEAQALAATRTVPGDAEYIPHAAAQLAVAAQDWPAAWPAFAATVAAQAARGKRWDQARTLWTWADALLVHDPAAQAEAIALLRQAQAAFAALDVPYYTAEVAARLESLH
jgi:hypothetical protein